MENGKVVKAVITSKLGGNLRLRVPNAMKLSTGGTLKTATGKNANPFYSVEETPAAIISKKAAIMLPELNETKVYDLQTEAGKTYTVIGLN